MPLGRESGTLQSTLTQLSATCEEKKAGVMATGGFKSNATTDFLEEWKAKREKMRAKMLGDIAAATGAPLNTGANSSPERGASAGNCHPSSYAVVRSSSGGALRRAEEEAAHRPVSPESSPRKATPPADKAPCASPDSSPMAGNDADKESPSPSKGKEKKSSGPSARKGKGQIEKRKLREKRRSTGVVSIPSNEVRAGKLLLILLTTSGFSDLSENLPIPSHDPILSCVFSQKENLAMPVILF